MFLTKNSYAHKQKLFFDEKKLLFKKNAKNLKMFLFMKFDGKRIIQIISFYMDSQSQAISLLTK